MTLWDKPIIAMCLQREALRDHRRGCADAPVPSLTAGARLIIGVEGRESTALLSDHLLPHAQRPG